MANIAVSSLRAGGSCGPRCWPGCCQACAWLPLGSGWLPLSSGWLTLSSGWLPLLTRLTGFSDGIRATSSGEAEGSMTARVGGPLPSPSSPLSSDEPRGRASRAKVPCVMGPDACFEFKFEIETEPGSWSSTWVMPLHTRPSPPVPLAGASCASGSASAGREAAREPGVPWRAAALPSTPPLPLGVLLLPLPRGASALPSPCLRLMFTGASCSERRALLEGVSCRVVEPAEVWGTRAPGLVGGAAATGKERVLEEARLTAGSVLREDRRRRVLLRLWAAVRLLLPEARGTEATILLLKAPSSAKCFFMSVASTISMTVLRMVSRSFGVSPATKLYLFPLITVQEADAWWFSWGLASLYSRARGSAVRIR
mmetsp:Transcript_19142/g.41307  ORF Transcript_19142/g.41307 Transcript_19142/m.41307 type:complete len:369 (+) Transcript_19142:1407-2513(+)